jgi:hypothetical protein
MGMLRRSGAQRAKPPPARTTAWVGLSTTRPPWLHMIWAFEVRIAGTDVSPDPNAEYRDDPAAGMQLGPPVPGRKVRASRGAKEARHIRAIRLVNASEKRTVRLEPADRQPLARLRLHLEHVVRPGLLSGGCDDFRHCPTGGACGSQKLARRFCGLARLMETKEQVGLL